MKKCAFLVLAAGAMLSTSNAFAGEPKLSALGLGSMKTMSHSQASTIRGQGAIVWGSSTATIFRGGYATSSNGYIAVGSVVAGGLNVSVAGNNRGAVYAGGLSVAGGF